MKPRLTGYITLLILLLALYLRGAGLFRGLDQDKIFHPDVPKQVAALENYLQDRYVWYVGSRFYDGYPFALNHVDEWILRGLWKIIGPAGSVLTTDSNRLDLPRRPQLYYWATGLRALYGLIILGLAALLAFRLFDRRAPAWGALLLIALAPLSIAVCHFASGDIGVDLFGAGLFLAVWFYLRQPGLARIALAGFLAGLAFAAKYNGALLLVMVAVTLGLRWLFADRSFRTALGHGFGALGAFLAGAALATPALFVNPKRTLIDIWINFDFIRNYGLPPGFAQKPWLEKAALGLSVSLPEVLAAFGWTLCLLLVAGTLLALWELWKQRATPADPAAPARYWIAAAGLTCLAVLGISALTKPSFQPFHFSYLILPLAFVAFWFLGRLYLRGRIGAVSASLLALGLLAETAAQTRWEAFFWRRSDTQVAAREYAQNRFFESLPAVNRGSDRYALKYFDVEPFNVAVFRNSPYKILHDRAEFWRQNPVAPLPWIAAPDAGSWMFLNGPVLPRNDRGFLVTPEQAFRRHLVFQTNPPVRLRLGVWADSRPATLTLRSGGHSVSRALDPHQTAILELEPRVIRHSAGAGSGSRPVYLVPLSARSRPGSVSVFLLDSPAAEAAFDAFARSVSSGPATLPTPPAADWIDPLSETRFVESPPHTPPLAVNPSSDVRLTPQPLRLMPGPYVLQCRVVFPAAATGTFSLIVRNGFLPDMLRFAGPQAWSNRFDSEPFTGLRTLRFPFVKTDAAPETVFVASAAGHPCEILDWSLQPDYRGAAALPAPVPADTAVELPPETPAPALTWNRNAIRLESCALPISVKTGEPLPLGFRFSLLNPDLPRFDELVIFMHLVGEEGVVHPLQGIPLACAAFGAGALNHYLADLPPDLRPGTYRIRIGLYNARTLVRLPMAAADPGVRIRRRAAEWTSIIVE